MRVTRRSPRGALPLRLSRALVVENDLVADACTAEVMGPFVVDCKSASLQARVTDGLVVVWEMGILNTFAREARTGERDRMASRKIQLVQGNITLLYAQEYTVP